MLSNTKASHRFLPINLIKFHKVMLVAAGGTVFAWETAEDIYAKFRRLDYTLHGIPYLSYCHSTLVVG